MPSPGSSPETVPIHWLVGATSVYLGATLAFLLAGVLLRGDRRWRGWATYSFVASAATVVLVVITFYTFSPGAPSSASHGGRVPGRARPHGRPAARTTGQSRRRCPASCRSPTPLFLSGRSHRSAKRRCRSDPTHHRDCNRRANRPKVATRLQARRGTKASPLTPASSGCCLGAMRRPDGSPGPVSGHRPRRDPIHRTRRTPRLLCVRIQPCEFTFDSGGPE